MKRRGPSARMVGFTLIEVIVVISVIFSLISLAVFAVQSSREASNRAKCRNNLRQIGLALQSYGAVINSFPPGNYGNGFSVHSMLLPYVEEQALYNSINFWVIPRPASRLGAQNSTAFVTRVETYLCPSDQVSGRAGRNSYAGNRGSGVQRRGYDGAFTLEIRGPNSLASFTDGTSTTSAASEWLLGVRGRGWIEPGRLVFETRPLVLGKDRLDEFADLCADASAHGRRESLVKGESWLVGELSFTLYNHVMKINEYSCTNAGLVQEGAWTAGSKHGSGAHVLFVDAHVSYIGSGVNREVWRAIGSRNGGEMLPESF